MDNKKQKKWWVTLLLSFFLGLFGADRFYLGYIGLGILKLATFGGFLFWAAIDLALVIDNRLPSSDGSYPDKKQPSQEELINGAVSSKDWLTALLYSVFYGWMGLDRFYLGYRNFGIFKLSIFLITFIIQIKSMIYITSLLSDFIILGELPQIGTGASFIITSVLSFGFGMLLFILWLVDVIMIALNKLPDKSGKILWKVM